MGAGRAQPSCLMQSDRYQPGTANWASVVSRVCRAGWESVRGTLLLGLPPDSSRKSVANCFGRKARRCGGLPVPWGLMGAGDPAAPPMGLPRAWHRGRDTGHGSEGSRGAARSPPRIGRVNDARAALPCPDAGKLGGVEAARGPHRSRSGLAGAGAKTSRHGRPPAGVWSFKCLLHRVPFRIRGFRAPGAERPP